MKIAKFPSLGAANARRNQYNNLARPPSNVPVNLVDIYKHTTLNTWWFEFSGCAVNGGLQRASINADLPNIDSEDFNTYEDLVAAGYLPLVTTTLIN